MSSGVVLSQKEQNQIKAVLYGQCIGDANGLLTEFLTKKEAKTYYKEVKNNLEFKHKAILCDVHRNKWKEGDWTDDSDQMLMILMSITDNKGKVDYKDIARRIKNWMTHGIPELGDVGGLGLGRTTGAVLHQKNYEDDPHACAELVWRESQCKVAPNGAVMRTCVVGTHRFQNLEEVAKNASDIARVTHHDHRCQASAVALSVAIAMKLQRNEKHVDRTGHYKVDQIIKDTCDIAVKNIEIEEQKTVLLSYLECKDIKQLKLCESGIGYTFKSLACGFWALKQNEFRKAITKIVMQGGDADTNACVAGALLGCKLGLDAIPLSWKDGLLHKEWLDQQISRFLRMTNGEEMESKDDPNSEALGTV
ncbi:ADP-ribosyl-[dinitrogen reductase] glycohydrolase [Magallana gigas]|uniref:ADP-ribosyl-[dinitrogen reductase] glycohydrolase n=1 Tax=Magallana gigas TaxID=29159 RepID=UPI00148A744E|nr:ADP-ribosylarginine hydrolase Tri1 [Crassostrea gigas]